MPLAMRIRPNGANNLAEPHLMIVSGSFLPSMAPPTTRR